MAKYRPIITYKRGFVYDNGEILYIVDNTVIQTTTIPVNPVDEKSQIKNWVVIGRQNKNNIEVDLIPPYILRTSKDIHVNNKEDDPGFSLYTALLESIGSSIIGKFDVHMLSLPKAILTTREFYDEIAIFNKAMMV